MSSIITKSKKSKKNKISEMDFLYNKCLELSYKGHTSWLHHLRISISKAVNLNWYMFEKTRSENTQKLSSFTIFNKINNYEQVYESRRHHDVSKITENGNVVIKSWEHKLEYANKLLTCMGDKPLLITGPIGCGKSTFINTLKDLYFKDQKAIIIHLDETTDIKSLIGTYYISETEISYKKGPLSIAAETGCWIIFKNIDKNPDLLSNLQISSNKLQTLSGQLLDCESNFKIIATCWADNISQNHLYINLDDLLTNDTNIYEICEMKYPRLHKYKQVLDRIIKCKNLIETWDLQKHLIDRKRVYMHELDRVMSRVDRILVDNLGPDQGRF